MLINLCWTFSSCFFLWIFFFSVLFCVFLFCFIENNNTQKREKIKCSATTSSQYDLFSRMHVQCTSPFFSLVTHILNVQEGLMLFSCNICSEFCCSCIINQACLQNRISFSLSLFIHFGLCCVGITFASTFASSHHHHFLVVVVVTVALLLKWVGGGKF